MSNSFIIPVIYCVRMRRFRVAFIEILLKKNYTQAEQFGTRLIGRPNIGAPPEAAGEEEIPAPDDERRRQWNRLYPLVVETMAATTVASKTAGKTLATMTT